MESAEFARITDPFPEPHLLVSVSGEVLALNRAAAALVGVERASSPGLALLSLVEGAPEPVERYLLACARSGSFLPGSFTLRDHAGRVRRYRSEGGGVRSPGSKAPQRIVLRLRAHEEASTRFLVLNRKLDALESEVHHRLRVQERLEDLAAELGETVQELERQRDIAETARAEAESANRAKSDFLAVMSHELRTPLNAVIGYADLLQEEIAGPLTADQRTPLERLRRCADHLVVLIDDILRFGRIEAGKERVEVEEVDLGVLVRQCMEIMEPAAKEKKLALRAGLPHRGPLLRSDPAKIRQVLINLIANAIKFTERGEVVVSVEEEGDPVRLSVRDTGIGIDAADVAKIFEPFTQIDGSSTRRIGGTGLGLTVSLRIARLLGGDIAVDSEPGRGSRFTVTLPGGLPG